MSNYRLSYRDQTYEFNSLSEAQEFLDSLPSSAGVEVTQAPALFRLINAPGAPITNWREIIHEVDNEFETVKTIEHRTSLLQVFKSTMDIAETTIVAEDLEVFREARKKHYKSFIVQESLVGESICIETLDDVTKREISAGRMSPDDTLRKIAEDGMAAPHFSRAEMVASRESPKKATSGWRRALAWLSRG
jgi:hypothetical protein